MSWLKKQANKAGISGISVGNASKKLRRATGANAFDEFIDPDIEEPPSAEEIVAEEERKALQEKEKSLKRTFASSRTGFGILDAFRGLMR